MEDSLDADIEKTVRCRCACILLHILERMLVGKQFRRHLGTGAGGGNTGPQFTLSVSPVSLALTQGNPPVAVQVSVSGANGFSASVPVTVSGLASGISVSPSVVYPTPGSPGTFYVSAAALTSVIGQSSISFHGTVDNSSANGLLSITVMAGAAVPFPFTSVGGYLVHGFYDASRQLLFAANPELNELDVINQRRSLREGPRSLTRGMGRRSNGRWKEACSGH